MGTAKEAAIDLLNDDLRDGRIKVAHERAPRRSHTLRKHLPMFEPRGGLPAGGRDECKNGERPCPYVRCKWHLWMVLSEDREGRPFVDKRDTNSGRFVPASGSGGGRRAGSTLEPRWLEYPTPACCALDVRDAMLASGGEMSPKVIADAMGRSYKTVWRIVDLALKKLRELDVAFEDFKP